MYQVPNVGGVYLKRQESITVTKCFESTDQRDNSGQNEAERLNACIGDALCDGGTLKLQIYKPLHGLSVDEISSLTNS